MLNRHRHPSMTQCCDIRPYLSLFESKSAYLHHTAIFSGNNKYGKRKDGHGPAYIKIMP